MPAGKEERLQEKGDLPIDSAIILVLAVLVLLVLVTLLKGGFDPFSENAKYQTLAHGFCAKYTAKQCPSDLEPTDEERTALEKIYGTSEPSGACECLQ